MHPMQSRKRDPEHPRRARERRPSARVAARQSARREDLLDHASALCDAHGLEGVTAAALAARAGVVPAALYRTFASLDEVRAHLVIRAVDALVDDLRRASAPHAGKSSKRAAIAAIVALARVLPTLQRVEPARFRLIDHALGALDPLFVPELRARVELSTVRALGVVEAAFAHARAVGAVSAADDAPGDALRTLALLGLVHGCTHLAKRDAYESDARGSRVVLEVALRATLIGLGASEALVDAALAGAD